MAEQPEGEVRSIELDDPEEAFAVAKDQIGVYWLTCNGLPVFNLSIAFRDEIEGVTEERELWRQAQIREERRAEQAESRLATLGGQVEGHRRAIAAVVEKHGIKTVETSDGYFDLEARAAPSDTEEGKDDYCEGCGAPASIDHYDRCTVIPEEDRA